MAKAKMRRGGGGSRKPKKLNLDLRQDAPIDYKGGF